ncbi:co-chaperone YbbN [Bacteriovorax sp. DB6_IX]|uniref:thioredoxin family protein n=1 Tax=Bacteriovorax sp. DB6_IX TaxID=1353530 RepID=UPI000389E2D6|nr:thioredoxin family protein [Bacteriovorax sp. DB6_IX]EQC45100.1 thioredoxin domain protein [Bacteriovorax sp. DB6_IX]
MKKLVKFTKSACPHCRVFDPIFKEAVAEYKGQLEFFEVSLDDAPHMAEIFKIRGVPALYSFESEDFKSFDQIEQITIGHSHENYSNLRPSLEQILEKREDTKAS